MYRKPRFGCVRNERGRNLGRFAKVQDGSIALFDEPVETGGRGKAAAGQFEIDGEEASEPGPDARGA